jgi:DNA ligase D-like protein (predicted ligase)
VTRARFIEPMLLRPTDHLPEGPAWQYELKLDGYRAIAFKSGGMVQLRSRNNKNFNTRYPAVVTALAGLPDETVIDGEIVALDSTGRPSFNALQHRGAAQATLVYYVFDVLILAGRDVMAESLAHRRALLATLVLPCLGEPVRESQPLDASLPDLVRSVKQHGLEGLVAKRRDSRYEPGLRTGAWQKMRVNLAEDFIIGGYTPGPWNFDALIFGHYAGNKLVYVARTRSGFTPLVRDQLFRLFGDLRTPRCSFTNLPETTSGRWGDGLTAEKMRECRWLEPVLVARVEFLEWTQDGHLRHARFAGLRHDAAPHDVTRQPPPED